MKKLLLVALLLLSPLGFSQTIDGITLGKSLTEVVSVLTKKGFKFIGESTVSKVYGGKLSNGDDVEITIVSTPKTKLVWKLIITEQVYSWDSAKTTFERKVETLITKYGPSSDSFKFFRAPYYDGDGYEMMALYKDKCIWASFWDTPSLSIEIRSFKYGVALIRISYENIESAEIYSKEKKELDSKTF